MEAGAAHTAILRRLEQGLQEEMMVAMLEVLQGAAAACAEICLERLLQMHKEMMRVFDERLLQMHKASAACLNFGSGAAIVPDAGSVDQEAAVKHRTCFYEMSLAAGNDSDDSDPDNQSDEEREGDIIGGALKSQPASDRDAKVGNDLEAMYDCDLIATPTEDQTFAKAPTQASEPKTKQMKKKPNGTNGIFTLCSPKEHWTPSITRKLLTTLREEKGEIIAKGRKRVSTRRSQANLPSSLQVDGVRAAKKVDPADGATYTMQELRARSSKDFSMEDIWGCWESVMKGTPETDGDAPSDEPATALHAKPPVTDTAVTSVQAEGSPDNAEDPSELVVEMGLGKGSIIVRGTPSPNC